MRAAALVVREQNTGGLHPTRRRNDIDAMNVDSA
jgi:hypothetical protein